MEAAFKQARLAIADRHQTFGRTGNISPIPPLMATALI